MSFLLYDMNQRVNYRQEAFIFVALMEVVLSKKQAHEMHQARHISFSGGENSNLEADYVLELLNGIAQRRIKRLGPNHSPEALMR